MSKFVELYRPYVEALRTNIGVGWWGVIKKYAEIGNSPGIYPDVGLLLERFVARDDIQTVVEFGSGMSTFILALACQKHGKDFVCIEEDLEWGALTQELLNHFGIDCKVNIVKNSTVKVNKRKGRFSISLHGKGSIPLPSNPDVIFYDCLGPSRPSVMSDNSSYFSLAKFILADDMETPKFAVPVFDALHSMGKTNITYFNPVGREDRVLLLATADQDEVMNKWVWEWRPDKVFW